MKAIIPAAGIGKRLHPHTLTMPKVMIDLAGKPLIGHVIDAVEKAGATSISIIVGYKKEQVEKYITTVYNHLNPEFPFQKERRGLGHAVLQALEEKDESVLILLGDTVFDVDFNAFVKQDRNVLGVVRVDDPRRFGVAEVDEQNIVKRLVEKPEYPLSDLALAGLYFIKDQRLLKHALETLIEQEIKTRGEYQLTDALQIMIDAGEKIHVHEIGGWYDCGTPESFLDSHRFLLRKHANDIQLTGSTIHPPVFIHPEAEVTDSVIGPNVTINKKCKINHARLSDVIVGKHARIVNTTLEHMLVAENSEITRSSNTVDTAVPLERKFD